MRIAFVAHHGSIHTRRWAGFFAARGHDVHVITCGDATDPVEGPYEVHELGAPRPPKLGYLARVPAARSLLRRRRPDIVHAHYATSYGLLGLASGVRPLVVTAHGSDVLLGRHNPVYRRVLYRVFRASSLVTLPSEEMRDEVLSITKGRARVEVLQYGVESARLAALAERERADPAVGAESQIVTARPLRPLYRIDVLLDALALLAPRRDDWACTIFGDGSGRDEAQLQAEALGLDPRVRFAGQRPADEVETGLARAHLYTSFSESDGASIALLEAMALGAGARGQRHPLQPGVDPRRRQRCPLRDRTRGRGERGDRACALLLDRACAWPP